MSASFDGLPYAMHSTPVGVSSDTRDLPFMNRFDQQLQVLEACRREHAMAEVEDMARVAASAPKNVSSALADQFRWAQQNRRVQVSLDSPIPAHPVPTAVERQAPIERNNVWIRGRDRLQQLGWAGGRGAPR